MVPIAIDTEWARGKPWCLSLTSAPGEAIVIKAGREYDLFVVNALVNRSDVVTVIHNALYDIPVLLQMGIRPRKIADTMVMAYLLQNEPQGLKQLAYRHCGMEMSSYGETVEPAMYRRAMEYLDVVRAIDWPKPDPELHWVDGEPKIKQPQGIKRKVETMLGKDPPDPWVKWKAMSGRQVVEDVLGKMPEGELCDIDEDDAVHYSARDADATIRVYPVLWERICALGLEDTFWRDMDAMQMVVDMQANGMPIDRDAFSDLSAYFQTKMDELQHRIQDIANPYWDGKYINPGSHPQMSKLIYADLELDKLGGRHKSKKGAKAKSTADDILKRYVTLHPVVQHIIDWRGYQKLKGTYSDAIPKLADPDNRIRCNLRITRTATGRLSASSPNLMAQPTRSEEGRRVRDCYVAPDGKLLLSFDFSQIEMRVAAHVAQDEKMLEVFWRNLDIHSQTASWMFDIPIDQLDDKEHRYPAKRIGFGVLYMLTADGLRREMAVAGLDWSLDRCERAIESWFHTYSGIAAFMKENGHFAKRHGYVKDMFGRIRYIPGIRSSNKWVRMEAERQAGNAPIQMGATGIMKTAMGRLVPVYRRYGDQLKPLLPIHDDIVWEVDERVLDDAVEDIRETMEGSGPDDFSLPVKVDYKYGRRWGSLKSP